MRRLFEHRLIDLVSFVFILLFTYTAVSKLLEFSSYELTLRSSPLIGNFAEPVIWLLIISEIWIGALLFFPSTRIRGLKFSTLLMLIFTGYIAYMLIFAPNLPCTCGGIVTQLTWRQHLWLNVGLIVLALAAAYASPIHKFFIAIDRRSRKPVKE